MMRVGGGGGGYRVGSRSSLYNHSPSRFCLNHPTIRNDYKGGVKKKRRPTKLISHMPTFSSHNFSIIFRYTVFIIDKNIYLCTY